MLKKVEGPEIFWSQGPRGSYLGGTPCIEEERPPAPPDSGKQLAEVIARLSQDEIGVVLGHLPSSTVQSWVQSISSQKSIGCVFWGLYCKVWVAFLPGKFSQL